MKSFTWVYTLLILCSSIVYADDIDLYVSHDITKTEKSRAVILFDTSGSMSWDVQDGQRCYLRERKKGKTRYREVECFDSSKTSTYCYKYNYWYGGYYRANCKDSRLRVAKNAIKDLVKENSDFEFGLMRLYQSYGGYVVSGLGADESILLSKIESLPGSGSTPITETLWEAYLYLTGRRLDQAEDRSDRDKNVEYSGRYISPFKPVAGESKRCDNSINMILMTDGDPTGDTDRDSEIIAEYKKVFGTSPKSKYSSYMSSLAQLLKGTDSQVVDLYPSTSQDKDFARVFTIGFGSGMSNNGKNLLELTAKNGGGKYEHATTATDLVEKFKDTITKIREINDSFASPAVSTNSADRTTHRDALYYTMFLPKTHTRWKGNLKKLKLKGGKIVDMNGKAALDEKGGVIGEDATTFWSAQTPGDGNNIQQGGVNGQLSKQITRKVYPDFNLGALYPFSYNKALEQMSAEDLADKLGTSLADSEKVMRWAVGEDVLGENSDGVRRKDIFGDPLHSRPVTMDYGNGDVRIFIGTNAGVLHAFKDTNDEVEESWAFMPGSLLKLHKHQMNKTPDTKMYGVDGPINVFHKDINRDGEVNGDDKVWLFVGLRRGGKEYYGIDITDPDTPKLMWGGPISPDRAGYEELGQTWSKPLVTYIRPQKEDPVIIFGAGYDTNKDNVLRTDDGMGRGIFIADAKTGKLVWSWTPRATAKSKFSGKHSIAADLSLMDSDYDGFTDRIYAADTAGNIWRVDMPRDLPNDENEPWTYFKLASLGGKESKSDRRFFSQPLVARTYFSKVTRTDTSDGSVFTRRDTPYDAILIGSGNRPSPLNKITQNHLFMIRDENTVTKTFQGKDIPSVIELSDLMPVEDEPFYKVSSKQEFYSKEVDLGKLKGWSLKLREGEKSLSQVAVVGGIAYFTTFMPANSNTENQCSLSGGSGSLYALHMHYGARVFDKIRYETARDVPDTPVVSYQREAKGENGYKRNSGRLIIALKPTDSSDIITNKPSEPLEPSTIQGPMPTFKSGVFEPLSKKKHGMTTKQMYIYKREDHDEK
jgi:type IV pilus assembly protein PilY1